MVVDNIINIANLVIYDKRVMLLKKILPHD